MKQLVLFTDAYGTVLTHNDDLHHYLYKTVHNYIVNGWRVVHVQGTGVVANSFNRGSFCFVLEQPN